MTQSQSLDLTKKYFGEWKRGNYVADIPAEPAQTGPRTSHIDWPSPTLPVVAIAFRGPAYSDVEKDKMALIFWRWSLSVRIPISIKSSC